MSEQNAEVINIDGKDFTPEEIKQALELKKLEGTLHKKGLELNEAERELQRQRQEFETTKSNQDKPKPSNGEFPSFWVRGEDGEEQFNDEAEMVIAESVKKVKQLESAWQVRSQADQIRDQVLVTMSNKMELSDFKTANNLSEPEVRAVLEFGQSNGMFENAGTRERPVYVYDAKSLADALERSTLHLVRDQLRQGKLTESSSLLSSLMRRLGANDLNISMAPTPPRMAAASREILDLARVAADPSKFATLTPEQKQALVEAGVLDRKYIK